MSLHELLVRESSGAIVAGFQEGLLLDAASIREVGAALSSLVEEHPRTTLVVDLGAMQFISSAGLGMFIGLRRKADTLENKIVFATAQSEILRLLHITGLDRLFEIYPDAEAALQKVSAAGPPAAPPS